MGTAQESVLRDAFSSIFGDRRGLTGKQAQRARYPELRIGARRNLNPLGRTLEARARRSRFLHWWVEEHEGQSDRLEGLLLGFAHSLAGTGETMTSLSGNSLGSDLRFFVSKGICEPVLHHSGPRYRLRAKEEWPPECLGEYQRLL